MRWIPAWLIVFAFCAIASRAEENARPAEAAEKVEPAAVALTPSVDVTVELLEAVAKNSRDLAGLEVAAKFQAPAFGFPEYPKRYSKKGVVLDRSNPLALRASATLALPAGEYQLLLRCRGASQIFLDDERLAETPFVKPQGAGEDVAETPEPIHPELRLLPIGHAERVVSISLDGKPHLFRLETIVGGSGLRPETGELAVAIAKKGEPFYLLGPTLDVPLTDEGWKAYASQARARIAKLNDRTRQEVSREEKAYWDWRHELAREYFADPSRKLAAAPAVKDPSRVNNAVDSYVQATLEGAGVNPSSVLDDLAFLRRVMLDSTGVIPTPEEIAAFRADKSPSARANAIDRLLADERWADSWVGYWQDVLAENPGLVKPELNNTGPFRWFIHESFRDNKPFDRFATELAMMEGSRWLGAPGAFAIASQNDAPMADKAYVMLKAFHAVDLKCARCHDAPYHPLKQSDTFHLAAMLLRKPQKVPKTSAVLPVIEGREPLVTISLKPNDEVSPAWPFSQDLSAEFPEGVIRDSEDTREKFAAILTAPANERFAEVIVNRMWKRYLGRGLVEPVDDWHEAGEEAPPLMRYLARELATHDYDLKHVARLIFNSQAYQRQCATEDEQIKMFAGPTRRRMSAEQIVDSLYLAAGKPFGAEELNLDPDGRNPQAAFMNLGVPERGWELASVSNERDRPALAIPTIQALVDTLSAFGWREARANPVSERDEIATPAQPLMLANGPVGVRVTRLTDDSPITELALSETSVEDFVRTLSERFLSREPSADERAMFVELLTSGFEDRKTPECELPAKEKKRPPPKVSWASHHDPEATRLQMEAERAVREGEPPTARLRKEWRERAEDVIWAMANTPEFLFVP